jgi:phosphoribosylanthranilate isomerase
MIRTVQLHGDEDANAVRTLAAHYNIIRGIPFEKDEVRRWDQNLNVDLLLVDGSSGGRGTTFAWTELRVMRTSLEKPLVVAGGLTPDNVRDAIRILRPYAVDVSSGVESALPGRMDAARVHAFCRAVRAAD